MLRPLTHSRLHRRNVRSAFTLLEVLVVVAILVILAGISSIYVFRYLEDAKRDKATLEARALEKAVRGYYTRHNDSSPPDNLMVLMGDPSRGEAPMIEGGQAALMGPWGQPYQLVWIQDQAGAMIPKVFTIDNQGAQHPDPNQIK